MTTTRAADEPTTAPVGPAHAARSWWGPDAPWWGRLEAWSGLLVLAACCAFILVQLEPGLLLRNTTPAGGDTAAHVWWPAYLRDHLLPWRLAGWSPDFYAGFPAGQFYFPVPALLIVLLDTVVPYNVAFKLITALGPVLLPVGAYVFGRGLRAPRPAPAAMAVAATAFVFFTGDPGTGAAAEAIAFNQHIMGGTLASNLAGEFSFTLALAFALMFFGTLAHSLRTGRTLWLPAVLLAACVMSHLVVAIFAGLGALVVWLGSRPERSWPRAAVIGGTGLLLTAVWTVPLVATLSATTDMRYEPITRYREYLFPAYLWEPQGIWPWQWGAAALIALALVGAVLRRRTSTLVVVVLTAGAGLLFRFWESFQATPAWNLRLLPFWYLGLFLLMGIGAAEGVRGVVWLIGPARHALGFDPLSRGTARRVRHVVIAGLAVVVSVGALAGVASATSGSFLPAWIHWNERGYEDTTGDSIQGPKSYPEYRSFIDTAATLPPGRLLWEGNTQLNAYGSPLALMLLPYWTHGRITSMEGVYYEASATSPYHFMTTAVLAGPGNSSNAVRGVPYGDSSEFSSKGVPWLQTLGVRYLAVHSVDAKAKAAADSRLTKVATVPDLDAKPPNGWTIFEVADAAIVTPLAYQPIVVDGLSARDQAACKRRLRDQGLTGDDLELHDWPDCIAVPWFNDPSALDRPLVAEGPGSWARAGPTAALAAPKQSVPETQVTGVRTSDDSVSFHVSRIGVPVMVKVSWFPNWEAEGARGPYRATPNFMVVVPTSHDVTLRYGTTTAEWMGRAGTALGVVAVVALAAWPWWRRRRAAREAGGTMPSSP